MSISKLSVNKPATVLIIFILLSMLGIYCAATLPLDLFPDMEIPYIVVMTQYGDADPEEVEKSVTRTLESSLSGVTGLKKLTSTSQTGMSLVILEFEYGTDLNAATGNIRDKIDLVRNYLPTDSKTPIIFQMDPSMMPIMVLVITGSRTPEELSSYVEDIIKPRLEQIDGVASATATGNREKQILVDVPRDRLDAYALTITQIAQMIGAQNITSSGGSIEANGTNYSISAEGIYKSVDEIKQTVVNYAARRESNGAVNMVSILLRDVADVYEGYKDSTTLAYLNGTPSVMLAVQKQSGKNSVAAAENVRKKLKEIKRDLPGDIEIVESFNTTDDIKDTIYNVVKSLLEGILLAVIVLYIFLRSMKSTFIIALAIPISVIVTLCLMYFCGYTINIMTLSGLLLGIGMLVDNAIVVLENIFSYRERDAKPEVAATLGAQEMGTSIIASTLTTVCIFLPMVMFKKKLGMMGQMFIPFASTIIFSLMCSLIVALTLVPVLSSKYLRIEKASEVHHTKPIAVFDKLMARFFTWLDDRYAAGVAVCLRHKKIVLTIVIVMFIASICMVKVIGFVFMPESVETNVTVELAMPKGTTVEATREVAQQLDANISRELKGVKFTTISVGGSALMSSASDSNTAKIRYTLYSESEREPDWDDEKSTKEKCRKYFNNFPGAECKFSSSGMSFTSSSIGIIIRSDSLDLARSTAKNIQSLMQEKGTDYVNEVTIDLEDGLPELKINMDRDRMQELGVTAYAAGAELNAAINGTTASRYDDNGTQVNIVVRMDEKDKQKFGDLENIYVKNTMGTRIPFASFSRYEETLAPLAIKRENQKRTVRVSVEPKSGYSIQVVQDYVEKLIRENIPQDEDVLISFDGSFADMIDAVKNFGVIILMAILLVFAVMASQFESFKEPFIIIFTIPFSIIGVVMIYLMAGQMMNIITVIGVLVLVGTIVNNGIVLVDYTNLLRKRGYGLVEGCVEACRNRLRPILMTTLTTVTSLIPMAFFPGETGTMTQPIGLTVLGGLTFGSCMTLFVMPVIYCLFNGGDERRAAKRALKAEKREKTAATKKLLELPEIVKRNYFSDEDSSDVAEPVKKESKKSEKKSKSADDEEKLKKKKKKSSESEEEPKKKKKKKSDDDDEKTKKHKKK